MPTKETRASSEKELVRIEVQSGGSDWAQEIRHEQFLKTAGATRISEMYIWVLGRVRAYVPRRTTIRLIQNILATMPDEDAMEAMEPRLEILAEHGYLRERRRP